MTRRIAGEARCERSLAEVVACGFVTRPRAATGRTPTLI
jgi:hypothetical protein